MFREFTETARQVASTRRRSVKEQLLAEYLAALHDPSLERAAVFLRYGPLRLVEPDVVVEIAFDRIQESKRHKSGYALRFPRIVRKRDDKSVEQISTLDEVRTIYEGQLEREKGR
ncbi:MAG: hypothetical protein WBX15_07090 [Thermoanaerobaculia bacterium]